MVSTPASSINDVGRSGTCFYSELKKLLCYNEDIRYLSTGSVIQHESNMRSGQLQVEQRFIVGICFLQVAERVQLPRRIIGEESGLGIDGTPSLEPPAKGLRDGCPIMFVDLEKS